jgi:predicted DCC family thiol-disulfide oxidoreductase YuxK
MAESFPAGTLPTSPRPDGPPFERLVLFDGVCGFCDGAVQWLMDRDPSGRLRFAPLQGEVAGNLRARHAEIPADIDTFVYVEARDGVETVSLRSQAVIAAFSQLDPVPGWLPWLRRVPRPLADLGYRLFASLRYRLFGKLDACRVPSAEERARFLD